ncbi:thiopeptide-type bacteriocin biosynthesis protein [Fodinicola acaciae]|uniref:thiopeptide-type bacteriocin biosynthesis protein n=1 Tax=Fodinicola acaciae TaxID=2681555 RepID=UPI0013D2B309|nr:thiopeptide-type bacteriocin biosynthesis protein [Fodinicola acaciae]
MLADHLTTPTPITTLHLAAAIQAILAGADSAAVAAGHALDPAELTDAVHTYQAAGLAALERRAERTWYDVRVRVADWSTAETVGTETIGPSLDRLRAAGAVTGWWFLRKHPCWRLRLLSADTAAVNKVLNEWVGAGAIERWWPTVYEAETAAFGGATGMQTVHDLFCADSLGVLEYLRQDNPALGRREISLLLLGGLMRTANLDTFECADVFDRVAHLRPAPTDTARVNRLADDVCLLLSIPNLADSELLVPSGPAAHAASWLASWQTAGRQLGRDAADGRLSRGLRAILTQVVIFHWNRLGLSAQSQGILARAATAALLPRS